MIPLRIELQLAGAIERPANPIHLDSLLAHQKVMRDLPNETDVPTIRETIQSLPLERAVIGEDWVWKASTIAFDWRTPPQQTFGTKSVRPEAIADVLNLGIIANFKPDSQINTASGTFKASIYAHERQWAPQAVAYCVGDPADITDLLSKLETIGARRRISGAKVTSFKIVEDNLAMTLWNRRNLPACASEGRLIEGAYRLPLFDPAHRTVIRDNHLKWADT